MRADSSFMRLLHGASAIIDGQMVNAWLGCRSRLRARALMLALVAVFALEAYQPLGASNVCVGNEAVEGLVVQRLVESGGSVAPTALAGSIVFKPPLFHWTAMALHRLTDVTTVTSTSLRATSALYALAG